MTEEKNLAGLGGWLILIGLGIVISPLKIMAQLFSTYTEIFSNASWKVLITPGTEVYNPLLGTILIGELLINVSLILAWIFIAILFFSEKKSFPKYYISILLFTLLFIVIDALAIKLIMPDEPIFDAETTKDFGRVLIFSLIFIPYMLLSKRVKATFIK